MRYLPEAMLMLAVTAGLGLVPQAPAGGSASSRGDWRDKVDPWVLSTAASGDTEFLVYLAEQADVSGARALETKEEKGRFVAGQLQAMAAATQGPVLAVLERRGVEHRAFWVANMIWVRGGLDVVQELAERDDMAHIYANPRVALQLPAAETDEGEAPEAIEWGVQKINAPQVWADGFTGQGVVIAGQDTGYQWDHPAIKNKYRGWNGSAADHNYNWHDAIHSGGGSCGPNSPFPCDDFGHGTHTMGTMVGDDGGSNQVGVAPGARWMGCRNMDVGNGTPATYSECFQWFIAPTDMNNQNPDPTRAPHVINNSWGCPPSEGCTDPNVLRTVVENTRAAGIVVVVSAGNSGSSCSTVRDPAAIYEASFSVGATSSTDTIASFSSRGPVTIDGSGRLKPNISGPGVSVRSSVPTNGYGFMSGTSMAGPHVAGAVGLLLAAHPTMTGDVDAIETLLERTALPRTTTQTCGGIPGTADPNNTYGYGRVDALSAVRTADVAVTLTASPNPVTVGQPLTFTATVSNTGPGAASRATLVDDLPASLTYVSATPSQGACTFMGGTVTCALGPIVSGASATVQIVTTPTVGGTVTNTVVAGAGQIDPAAANNTAWAAVVVGTCSLGVPNIFAPLDTPPGTTGLHASAVPMPNVTTYTWTLTGGVITAGQGTSVITFTAGSAGTTMILTAVASIGSCSSPPGRRNVQVHFLDVPPSHQFHTFVNTLARNQVTGGCGGGNYCPEASVAREQMAVFLLASKEGSGYAPPACTTPVFGDVPCGNPFAAWVNELAARGVTSGCGGGNYCPAAAVTREQMAPFLLLTKEGSGYTPPACSAPVFADVPCASPFARWINELSARGVTSGCGGGNYCPAAPNTRGEMAVFLVRTFGLN